MAKNNFDATHVFLDLASETYKMIEDMDKSGADEMEYSRVDGVPIMVTKRKLLRMYEDYMSKAKEEAENVVSNIEKLLKGKNRPTKRYRITQEYLDLYKHRVTKGKTDRIVYLCVEVGDIVVVDELRRFKSDDCQGEMTKEELAACIPVNEGE